MQAQYDPIESADTTYIPMKDAVARMEGDILHLTGSRWRPPRPASSAACVTAQHATASSPSLCRRHYELKQASAQDLPCTTWYKVRCCAVLGPPRRP